MKTEIKPNGYIEIVAETAVEAFALKHLLSVDQLSPIDKIPHLPIIFDFSILNDTGGLIK